MRQYILRLFTVLAFLSPVLMQKAQAQVSGYTFAQTTGTYSRITGGTVPSGGTATGSSGAASLDDVIFNLPTSTIPFTFTFAGTGYTGLNISTNGFITFGTTAPATTYYTPISGSTAYAGAISAWGKDINSVYNLSSTTGEVRYQTVGTSPNREFVVQWKNFRPALSSSTTSAYVFDMQIRLQENGNKVVIMYGGNLAFLIGSTGVSGSTTTGPQIGLRGSSTSDYNNRTNASTTAFTSSTAGGSNTTSITQAFNTSAATPGMPSSGLTYTWTPPACSAPSSISAASVTATTATLNWTAPGTAPSNGYEYEVRSSGAAGSGATGLAASGSTAAGVVTANITGLTASTTYSIYVRSNCGGAGYSAWTAATTFTTLCNTISSFPWTEGFEGITTTGALIYPNCWAYTSSANVQGTDNANAIVGATYGGARTGTKYAYFRYSNTGWMFTPGFALTAGNAYTFSFYMQNKNGTAGFTMDVAYGSSQTSAAMTNVLQSSYAASNTSYQLFTYTVVPSTTGTYYFGVKSTSATSTPWYLTLDDFSLESIACSPVSALTASAVTNTTATISWTAPTLAPSNGYQYEVRTSGAAGSGATGLALSGTTATGVNTANLTGLTPNTAYSIYVRSDCSGSGYSAWTPATTFTTLCNPVTTPYTENFDGVTAPAIPSCSKVVDVAADANTWVTSASGSSLPNALYQYYAGASGADDWWFTPGISMTNGSSYRITFKYQGSSSYTNKLELKTGTGQSAASMGATALWSNAAITNSTYQTATVDYTATSTGVQYFGFHNYSATSNYYLYLDDVSIIDLYPCMTPTAQPTALNLSVVSSTSNSGSFTAASGATNYLVVRTTGSSTSWNQTPADGTSYTAGNTYGNGVVIANGTGTTFTDNATVGGTTYTYSVYAFNGPTCSGTNPLYLATSPLMGTVGSTVYTATTTGNWSNSATWDANGVPANSCNSLVRIAKNVTVTLDVNANVSSVLLFSTSGLTVSSNTLDVCNDLIDSGAVVLNGTGVINIGTGNTYNSAFAIRTNGSANMSAGTMNIKGQLGITGGNGFVQTGGAINIDPTSATAYLPSGMAAFMIQSTPTGNSFTGGTITIANPPHSSLAVGTTRSVSIAASATNTVFGGTHTIILGDGVSTIAGNTDGFVVETYLSSVTPINNLTVNGGSTTGRWASGSYNNSTAYGTHIKGNLTINSGSEFRSVPVAGNSINFAIGGNIVNNGTFTNQQAVAAASALQFGEMTGATTPSAQTVSGTGVFRNGMTAADTSNFRSITVKNGNGVTFNTGADVSFTGTFTLSVGTGTVAPSLIKMGAYKLVERSGAGQSGPSATNGWVVGYYQKGYGTGTFPVGTNTVYTPFAITAATFNPSAGSVWAKTTDGDQPNLSSSTLSGIQSVNRYWTVGGTATVTTAAVTLNYVAADNDALSTPANYKIGLYASGAWTYPTISGTPTTTQTLSTNSITTGIYGDYVVAEQCTRASLTNPTTQPTSLVLNLSGNAGVSGSFTAATPSPTNYLVVRTVGSGTSWNQTPADGTVYTVGNTYGNGIIVAYGTATSFTDLTATNNTFTYNVYSVNVKCFADQTLYNATSPLSDNITASSTYTATTTGNWSDPATWDANGVPPASGCTNFVKIASGVTVTLDVNANVGGVTLAPTSGLIVSANTLDMCKDLIDSGAVVLNGTGVINIGNGNTYTNAFAVRTSGSMNMSAGTLNIKGQLGITGGNGFVQTGGAINIDPTSATAYLPSGTPAFLIQGTHTGNSFTGGTITIANPPHSSLATSSTRSVSINSDTTNTIFSGTHTIILGDGVSTIAGNTDGFVIESAAGGVITKAVPLNNVTVNGGSTTGRWTSGSYNNSASYGTYIRRNLTINSGSEFRTVPTLNNAIVLAIGGNIVNNGTMTSQQATAAASAMKLGEMTGATTPSAQTISGSGVFQNNTTGSTANFRSITVKNGNGITLNTGSDLSFSAALTFSVGTGTAGPTIVNTGSYKLVQISGASYSGASTTVGWVNGTYSRGYGTGTFPVGNATVYAPFAIPAATISPSSGDIWVKVTDGDHPNLSTGTNALLTPSKSVNRYWTVAGTSTFTTASVQITYPTTDNDPAATPANYRIGLYANGGWTYPTISGTPTNTTISSTNSITTGIYGDYAIAEQCNNTVSTNPTTQPTTLNLSALSATSNGGSFTAATTPGATNYLVVRTAGSGTSWNQTPTDGVDYVAGTTYGNGIVIAIGTGTTFTDNNTVVSGTTYSYSVYAYNANTCAAGSLYNASAPLTGSITAATIYTATTTGNWSNAATWDSYGVPANGCASIVNISSGVAVTLDVNATVSGVIMAATSGLTVSSNTLNVCNSLSNSGAVALNGTGVINIGTGNTYTTTFTNDVNSSVNMSGGTMNIKGRLTITGGTGFVQTAGDISIDPTSSGTANAGSGNAAFSIASGIPGNSFTGGTITIVNPPHSSLAAGSTRSVLITSSATNANFGGTHTIILGDGSSTIAGNSDGFVVETYASGVAPINNLTINGGSTTGRWGSGSYSNSTIYGTHIKGNLTINSGSEFRTVPTAGNAITFVVGGNIVNNGTMTSQQAVAATSAMQLGEMTGATTPSAQTISGSGVFRNGLTAADTSNFRSITVKNGNGVTFNTGADVTFTGTTTFSVGTGTVAPSRINMGSYKLIERSGASNSGASATNGWVVGYYQKGYGTGTFPIGGATVYTPFAIVAATFNPSSGSVWAKTTDGDYPGLASGTDPRLFANKSVNRYWTVGGTATVTTASISLTYVAADNDGGTTPANYRIGLYNNGNTTWTYPTISGTPSTTFISSTNSITTGIYGDYAVAEACVPATITTQPTASTTVCAGQNFTLSVVATNATGTPNYQWNLNGTPITGANSASYAVTGAAAANAGTYTVTVNGTSPCGSLTSNNAVVTVNPAVAITAQPTAQTVCSGTNLTLSVTASNATSYQWKLNGTNISGATSATYSVASAAAGNAGNYSVVVSGTAPCAAITSSTVAVTVNPAVVITTQPTAQTVCEGSALNLSVSATNATGYQWYKGGSAITGATAATYNVASAASGDADNYYVEVSGTAPCATTSNTVAVTVNPAVVITAQPTAQTVCSGTGIGLSVTATNATGYQWYKGGSAISGATSATYNVATAAAGDAGNYYVVVSGTAPCATTSSTAAVVVNPAVAITTQPVAQTVCSGSGLTLSVTASNAAGYQWYQDGNAISGATSATYTVASASASDAGNYYVSVGGTAPCTSLSSDTVAVIINAVPAITASATSGTVCSGGLDTLNVSSSGSNYTYVWNTPTPTTGAQAYANPTATRYYRVTATDGVTGCIIKDSVQVSVEQYPTVTFTPSAASIGCGGAPVQLTATVNTTGTVTKAVWKPAGYVTGVPLVGLFTDAAGTIAYDSTSQAITTAVYAKYSTDIAYNLAVTTALCPATTSSNSVELSVNAASGNGLAAGSPGANLTYYTQSGSDTIQNSSCQTIASVAPTGASPVSGLVMTTVYSSAPGAPAPVIASGRPYVPRYYQITPENNAATSTGTITLYATNDEFKQYNTVAQDSNNHIVFTDSVDYNNVRLYLLPDQDSPSTIAERSSTVLISKESGTSATGLPGSFSPGVKKAIRPSLVAWNATDSRWEITFSTTGFSGFFIGGGGSGAGPLPVTFTGITATAEKGKNRIEWNVGTEDNVARYEVEKQAGGVYETLGTLPAAGIANYVYYDPKPSKGLNTYRVKAVDVDGGYSYSPSASVRISQSGGFELSLYPNPTSGKVTVEGAGSHSTEATVTVSELSGRVLIRQVVSTKASEIDLSGLPSGTYMLQWSDGINKESIRVTKQ